MVRLAAYPSDLIRLIKQKNERGIFLLYLVVLIGVKAVAFTE